MRLQLTLSLALMRRPATIYYSGPDVDDRRAVALARVGPLHDRFGVARWLLDVGLALGRRTTNLLSLGAPNRAALLVLYLLATLLLVGRRSLTPSSTSGSGPPGRPITDSA